MSDPTPLLTARGLVTRYPLPGGGAVNAVADVDLDLFPGETLAVVGESGCGKSTLARSLLRLVEPASGSVRFLGHDLLALGPAALRQQRREMQLVFQDPMASLDPRFTIGRTLAEPMLVHGVGTSAERHARVATLLDLVGLDPAAAQRYPHEFSGGQRQRIAIARAIALEPRLVVLDEPVSALDVSIQSQVLNLLMDLKARLGLTYLFITHDLAVVGAIADRVAVMYLGRIVEDAPVERLFAAPAHPYTRALLAAVPVPDPTPRPLPPPAKGNTPHPQHPPPPPPKPPPTPPGSRRAPQPRAPAARLPIPPTLPQRRGDLPDRPARTRRGRAGPPRPLPLRAQHSTTLTAKPPSEVSLYFAIMSRPVWRMVSITRSRGTKCVPSPRRAKRAALIAFTAPMVLRSMQGIWTRPAIGSQVRPRLCSMPISAAFSTCSLLPPSTAHKPPAAIEQATPTSPWQPTSAAEIEAFSL